MKRIETITVADLARTMYSLQQPQKEGREGYDALIAITGKTGYGKSDLSLSLSYELSKLRNERMKVEDTLIWTRKNLVSTLQEREQFSTFIVDEAIKVLFSKEAQKNVDLTKTLNICRSKNYAVILNIPALSDMERNIRDNRLRFAVWIKRRGEAYLFRPDNKPQFNARQSDPWNSSLIKKYEQSGRYHHHPNCIARITFEPCPDFIREEYDRLKEEHGYEEEEEERVESHNTVERFIHWLEEEGLDKKFFGLKARAADYLGITQLGPRLRAIREEKDTL